MRTAVKDDTKAVKAVKEDTGVEAELVKVKLTAEESESQKPVATKERNIDLQLDLEKSGDRDSGTGASAGNKINQHVPKQQHNHQPSSVTEKAGEFNYLFFSAFFFLKMV